MQNSYLIPANTKKSQYVLGFFTWAELGMFAGACILSLILLFVTNNDNIGILILKMLPTLITAFLVMPVPHYHNVLQLLTNIVNFYTNRRRYYWKGWNIYEEFNGSRK